MTSLKTIVPGQIVDGDLLARYIDTLSKFGALPTGGINRPPYSEAWIQATQAVAQWMEQAGLEVRRDAVGNVWGRLGCEPSTCEPAVGEHVVEGPSTGVPGTGEPAECKSSMTASIVVASSMTTSSMDASCMPASCMTASATTRSGTAARAVVTGSHIDTVRGGGRLDGAYGILAAITAVSALRQHYGQPRRPLEVLAVCEEEGSHFSVSSWGCRAITGRIQPGEAALGRDAQGITIDAAMRNIGLDPDEIPSAARAGEIGAFLELHIEQGGVLERESLQLGVVTSIVGSHRVNVTVTGRPDHAGTTPMALRSDALVGAAAMVLAINRVARSMGNPAVATVGRLIVEPDQSNVVPGVVRFTVDVRHAEAEPLEELVSRIVSACEQAATEHGVAAEINVRRGSPPKPMAPELVELLESVARESGVSYRLMPSGAGHDSKGMAGICPAAMLFVPSICGRSHCPNEDTAMPDLVRGAEMLARALKRLCY